MIMQVHEQYIVRSDVVTQEMAQYVNALIRENEEKSLRIASLVKEFQVQSGVLRKQQEGQQVLAEVLKMMMAGRRQEQQQPQQGSTVTGPTVTEVDDNGTDPNFPNAPSPNSGPANHGLPFHLKSGTFSAVVATSPFALFLRRSGGFSDMAFPLLFGV